MKKYVLLLSILFISVAFSQESVEDLKRLLEEYKKKIQEIERRLEELEKAKKEEEKKKEAVALKPTPADRTLKIRTKYEERLGAYQVSPFSQKAFLPDISLILDFSFVGRNKKDSELKELEIPALYHGHGGHEHGELNEKRGFNLNYAELFLYAPVDPYFDLYATIPFSEDGSTVEEAYAVTRGLPYGFQVKVGKFRSSFGRLNSQHPHVWEFANPPLVYKVFLGEGLIEKGVQVNWLAPVPFYLLLGAEVLQGENEMSFGTEGFSVNEDLRVPDTPKPNLYVGFLKTSFDVGNLSLLGGISYAYGRTRINHLEDEEEPHAFAGRTKIYGLDLTAKYFIDSYRYLAFQGEYLYRRQEGTKYTPESTSPLTKKQGGLYAQVVWKFDRRWRTGIQYNLINKNELKVNGIKKDLPDDLSAYYWMLEFNPTEFSRIRLQLGQNRAFYKEDKRKTINEFIFQFNFVIGAHTSHPF
ncbi:hypothetical protein [Aquifex aeolicus]|uniref:Uncharacterized protein aq_2168 n=1 Tax=Aquifex aeolicus (strain VF5) TaxID=224324 RepID=Y2168_AQUAE|nr:hypothetical protein [Aquifex aeolicus]O67918.1 RecName: Full=Uncharacterized protein aq_2168 [Aquifex aeolicus VF5]AAC07889.1 putative protein [Aquifex aeolicus VF5]